jgi:uncharacterized metal-binding protein
MPSGKTHAKWGETLTLAWGIGYGVTYALGTPPIPPNEAAAIGVGLVVGILITPDIDLMSITHEERRIQRHFGRLAKRLWILVWRQYARGIRHRCPLSHAPIRSTLIRAAYLWPAWVFAWWLVPHSWWTLAGWLLAGWIIQDTLHWTMDITMRGG